MSYFNYWISVLVVFAIVFLFARTISNEKQIVAFFSKLIYVVIVPANIAISLHEITYEKLNIKLGVFFVYLWILSKIMTMIFQINSKDKDSLEPAFIFSNILVMKPFLENVMDKNILNNLIIISCVIYLVYMLYKRVFNVTDFLMAMGFSVAFCICSIYKFSYILNPLAIIQQTSSVIIIIAFAISINRIDFKKLLDLTSLMLAAVNLLIIPVFTYVVVSAVTNNELLIKSIIMYTAIGPTFVISSDFYNKTKLRITELGFLLSVVTMFILNYLFF
ncbi:MAG: hypothetical protein E6Y30_04885 [Finegoldia magna]|nr:hypothetical protein [Finegoldia magna]